MGGEKEHSALQPPFLEGRDERAAMWLMARTSSCVHAALELLSSERAGAATAMASERCFSSSVTLNAPGFQMQMTFQQEFV